MSTQTGRALLTRSEAFAPMRRAKERKSDSDNEKSVQRCLKALDDELDLIERDKQQKINDLDVVVPLRLHQIQMPDGELPTDLSQVVVMDRTVFQRLQNRIPELKSEVCEQKQLFKEARQKHARLKRKNAEMGKRVKALADLHEAARLSPSNREIRRLLARVEEECKHHQKALSGAVAQSLSRDQHSHSHHLQTGEDEHDVFSQGSLERPIPVDHSDQERDDDRDDCDEVMLSCGKSPEFWPLNPYAANRTLPGSFGLSDPSPCFSPDEYPLFGDLPEPVPALNRQGNRTHLQSYSLQAGRVGGRPLSLCGPSSPLPGRHISTSLRPAPLLGIDIGSVSSTDHGRS
ncbi:hypothetical protein WMY93_020585 [Mugilogobius chulae]|uniref:BHLH domain-containing protein n=1 Tax=Mugilogobius chulae TaxID=88201 RepID=A0AAW0N9W2_9GOBI